MSRKIKLYIMNDPRHNSSLFFFFLSLHSTLTLALFLSEWFFSHFNDVTFQVKKKDIFYFFTTAKRNHLHQGPRTSSYSFSLGGIAKLERMGFMLFATKNFFPSSSSWLKQKKRAKVEIIIWSCFERAKKKVCLPLFPSSNKFPGMSTFFHYYMHRCMQAWNTYKFFLDAWI